MLKQTERRQTIQEFSVNKSELFIKQHGSRQTQISVESKPKQTGSLERARRQFGSRRTRQVNVSDYNVKPAGSSRTGSIAQGSCVVNGEQTTGKQRR